MARIALHFIPGESYLHHWDARCKIIGFLIISISLIQTKFICLVFDSVLLMVLLSVSRVPLRPLFRDFRIWIIFLLFICLVQGFFSPGKPLFTILGFQATREGMVSGVKTAWRLGLILGYAVLFTALTRPRSIQQALIWFLDPIPFIRERRISLMVSLAVRFFSTLLDQTDQVQTAYRARLGDLNKNPLRRAKGITLPVLRRSFLRVDEVAMALIVRGFREEVSFHPEAFPWTHLIPLIFLLALLAPLNWLS